MTVTRTSSLTTLEMLEPNITKLNIDDEAALELDGSKLPPDLTQLTLKNCPRLMKLKGKFPLNLRQLILMNPNMLLNLGEEATFTNLQCVQIQYSGPNDPNMLPGIVERIKSFASAIYVDDWKIYPRR